LIGRTTVLTFMDAQFIGFTGHPFFDYKIKSLFDEFKGLELSRQTTLQSGISGDSHFVF